jgi:hypothetical protein
VKLRQLSLFLENRPGALRGPCEALGRAGIDILTLSLADTQQFGILRLVVREEERAREVLEAAGCVVRLNDVLAVEVPDRAGGLADVLGAFEGTGISVEYLYPLVGAHHGRNAVLVLRVEDSDRAVGVLQDRQVRVLSREEAFAAVGA